MYDKARRDKQPPLLKVIHDDELDLNHAANGTAPPPPVNKTLKTPVTSLEAPYLPPLPAKHAWRQTPVYPQSTLQKHQLLTAPTLANNPNQQVPSAAAMAHLSTLRSRLADSQLVASSLRNLIRKTTHAAPRAITFNENGERLVKGGVNEDESDVIDYESVWYGAAASRRGGLGPQSSAAGGATGPGQKKRATREVMVIHLAREGEEGDERDALGLGLDDEGGKQSGVSKGMRGAASSKRRKWRA